MVFSRGRNTRTVKKKVHKNLFDENDWRKWLKNVNSFYKKSSFREVASPLIVNKDFDNRPYISIKLFDREVVVLFDSGCTTSVVGEKGIQLIESLNLRVYPSNHNDVSTADGTLQSVKGVVDLPVFVENCCQIVKALVVPSIPQAFIFGSDFAKQFGISINFRDNCWHVCSTSSDFPVKLTQGPTDFEKIDYLYSLDELTLEQRDKANLVVQSFQEISSENKIGRTNKITLNIDTGDAVPFKKRPYVMSPYMLKILNEELDDMIKLGVVEPSKSPWCSPVLLVKKDNKEYRFCFDGRSLNHLTKHDSYPMPNIDRILNMLRGANFISSIDLRKSFWQIPLTESSREKTAFGVVGRGLFQFVTMPFGLCNAAQTQQRLVDAIFGPRYEPKIFCYLDDIIICSSTFEEHVQLLSEVKERLQDAGLTINLKKCSFFKKSLKYLGYIVGSNSLKTDPEKVSTMVNYPRPTTATEIKRFIGLCSWYRRFIKNFSSLVSPINDLLKGKKKSQPISWTAAAEASFVKIKELLVSAPILCQPDFAQPFIIECDSSDTGLGGVLIQKINDEERVIAYASKTLSRSERNFSVTERELLAVIFSIDKFRPWIEGTRFTVVTDHASLLWLNNMQNPAGRLARWAVKLRQHSFDLVHRKGRFNVVPDCLSRIPVVPDKNLVVSEKIPVVSDKIPVVSEKIHVVPNEISVVPEISTLIEVDPKDVDKWYRSMRERITSNPDNFPQWKIENDVVLKFVPSRLPLSSNLSEWKFLVPNSQRKRILESCHNPPTSGHFGFFKTFSRLQEKYYWPQMRMDVLKFVRSCLICGAQKSSNQKSMGLMGKEKIVNYPFQILAIDLMGPFPRSKKGHKWLVVVGDWFTKYNILYPLRSAKAHFIEDFLENKVFLVYGVPELIICDNATNFSGHIFKNLCKKYEVRVWYNAVYSPQCNFVERANKTIGTAIRSYIATHDTWDEELTKIQFALNTAKHEITGHTPSFLNFARHVPISGKYYGNEISLNDIEIMPGNRDQYAAEIKELSSIFGEIRKKLHDAYLKNARHYNLRKRDISFRIGDKVWRKNKVLSQAGNKFSAKLAPRFVMCTVKKKFSKLVYELTNSDGSNAGKWHIKDLKPYNVFESEESDNNSVSVSSDNNE